MSFYTYKFRAYPTPEQAQLIDRTIGCSRFVYNYLLADCKAQYEATGASKIKSVGALKKIEELEFLKEVDALALCNAYLHLQSAYSNFFRNLKKGKVCFPKFKSKKTSKWSYTTNNTSNTIRIEHKGLRLPKVGYVSCKFHRFVEGKIKSVTVTKSRSNKYFVSILVDRKDKITERVWDSEDDERILGIDMSIPDFAVYSDGTKPKHMHYYRQSEKRIQKAQRKLSRKQKDSRNREKQRLKLAKAHERAANQRKTFIEMESSRISKEFDVVVVEDINLQAMSRCLHFGKSVNDNGFGLFRVRLDAKMNEQLKTFIVADKWYPSSKLCSCCGSKNKDLQLKDREWDCPICGAHHDRDYNAALNLRGYYVGMQRTKLTPMEIGSVDDRSQDPKKHPINEVGKIASMVNPKSQAFCFS